MNPIHKSRDENMGLLTFEYAIFHKKNLIFLKDFTHFIDPDSNKFRI